MAWAELTDVRCYYEVLGQGEPLLLVPGLGVTCRTWDPVLPELARHFTLIMVDNRGLGMSQSRRPPRSTADYSADLLELLDFLQLERAHVMGLSLGGIISQRFAVDHPSRVDRLVLVSCADRFSPYLRQTALLLRHALRRFAWDEFAQAVELLGTSPHYVDANEKLVEERLRAKCEFKVDRRSVATQLRCLASSELSEQDYRIIGPTLVISGDDDRLIPACYVRQMAEKIRGSKFVLLERCGHNPFQEKPDEVLPLVIDFLHESRRERSRHAGQASWAGGHGDCNLVSTEMST
jgi:pimeloyl-ACP methyl ester carboxylesterase